MIKKYSQYIKESFSGEVSPSEFYVVMFEKSGDIPAGLIEEYKKSKGTKNFHHFANYGYKKYIKDFADDDLKATENIKHLDTFELIELGYQNEEDCKTFLNFVNVKIEEFLLSASFVYTAYEEYYRNEIEKYHGKLIIKEFQAIAQASDYVDI
jgi:hypothetical protein